MGDVVMSGLKLLVKEKATVMDYLNAKLDNETMDKILNGKVLVVVNGKLVNSEEIAKKTVKPNDIILIIPKIYGG